MLIDWRRVVRVSFACGLALALVSTCAVVRAQSYGESMPLITALQSAAMAAKVDLVVADVPMVDVYMPSTSTDWMAVVRGLAGAHGLQVCELSERGFLVTGSPHWASVCDPVRVGTSGGAEGGRVGGSSAPAGRLTYRVRVVQVDETRAAEMGISWDEGVFRTAGMLVAGVALVTDGYFPAPDFGRIVSFLESEGVGTRLEDVTLESVAGVPVSFNRGGSINVNLPASGGGSIQQSFAFGLGLDMTGVIEGDSVRLSYSLTDSSPSNVSDPTNVQLASTTSRGEAMIPCGHAAVIASIGSERTGGQGSGLPGISAVPVVGYAGGRAQVSGAFVSYVVTVDVECR